MADSKLSQLNPSSAPVPLQSNDLFMIYRQGSTQNLGPRAQDVLNFVESNITLTASSGIAIEAGGNSQGSGVVTFGDSNGISFSLQNGTLIASYTVPPAQSVQTQDIINAVLLGGNIAGAPATISSGTMTLAGGDNVTLSQAGNAVTIHGAPPTAGAAISAGTQSQNTGTVIFSNSNGLAFGLNNGTITGSYTVPAQSAQPGIQSVSAGTTRITTGELVLSNANGVTFGADGQTITASVAAAGQSILGVSADGNTAGNTIVTNFGTYVFVGTNNITLSQDTADVAGTRLGVVTISGANMFNAGVSTGGNTAGNTGTRSNQVVFVGSNNITLSQTTGAGGATISIIGAAGGGGFSAGVSNIGNTAGSTGVTGTRLVFVGQNFLTLSQSTDANGGTISIRPRQVEAGVSDLGNTAGDTGGAFIGRVVFAGGANVTLSQTRDAGQQSATITIIGAAGGGGFSAGVSNLGNTAGSTGVTGTRLVLVGTNHISLSQSTNANGGTVSINGPLALSLGVSDGGNTAGNTTVSNFQRYVFQGGNNITLSQSTLNLGGGTTLAVLNISGAAAGGDPGEVGVSTIGNTAGTTGVVEIGRYVLVGSNNITLSQSVDGASGTLSIIGAAGGGGGSTFGHWYNPMQISSTTQAIGNGTMQVVPIQVDHQLTATQAIFLASLSISSSSNSSHAAAASIYMGIYSATSNTLSLLASGSQSYQWTNTSNNSLSSLSGVRRFTLPIDLNLVPGLYYLATFALTSSTNANWASFRAVVNSQVGAVSFGTTGQTWRGPGYFEYSSTTNAFPNSIGTNSMNTSGVGIIFQPFVTFMNYNLP